jgi:hypothetical protein
MGCLSQAHAQEMIADLVNDAQPLRNGNEL